MAPLLIPLGVVGSGKLEPSEYWLSAGTSATNILANLSEKDNLGNSYNIGNWGNSLGKFVPVVVKRDFLGEPLWAKAYSYDQGSGNIFPTVSSTGDIFLAGTLENSSSSSYAGFIKINSSGTPSLARVIGNGTDSVSGGNIGLDSSGNIYFNIIPESFKRALTKFNSSGTLQWAKEINGQVGSDPLFQIPKIATEQSTGSTYVYGYSSGGAGGSFNGVPALIKVSSSGSLQWARYMTNSSDVARAQDCVLDSSGNIYISGSASNYSFAFIAKFNSSGTLQWQKQFGSGLLLPTLAIDSNSVYALIRSSGTTILKFDLNGNLLWQRSISNYSSFYTLQSMAIDTDNDMFISADTVNGNFSAGMIKLPNDGSLTGTHGPITYAASALSVSNFNSTWSSYSPTLPNITMPTIASITPHQATPTITYAREDIR